MDNYNIMLTEQEIKFLTTLLDWAEKNAKDKSNQLLSGQINEKFKAKLLYEKSEKFNYLEGLSKEGKEFFFKFREEYNINLYHSIASVLNSYDKTLEECFNYYYMKYKEKRPFIVGKENELIEIINLVVKRIRH